MGATVVSVALLETKLLDLAKVNKKGKTKTSSLKVIIKAEIFLSTICHFFL